MPSIVRRVMEHCERPDGAFDCEARYGDILKDLTLGSIPVLGWSLMAAGTLAAIAARP